MLEIADTAYEKMVAECIRGFPNEACGMLIGDLARVSLVHPADNVEGSARLYTVAPVDLLRADRAAHDLGLEIVGVYHSHTHSEAYPSPTDVRQAPDRNWWYVVVSLRRSFPEVRAYRILGADVEELAISLV